jgi:two-component system aerobic respiration control sensor histidine kinase ArcB
MKLLNMLLEKLNIFSDTSLNAKHLQESIINRLPNYYIFWKDKNSIFLGCNKTFANLAGLNSPDEIVGKSDYDFAWSKEDSDIFIKDDKEVMSTRQPKLNMEESQILPNGERIILLTSKIPLVNKDNEVFGVLGISCNVTEQKLLETNVRESNQRLEHAYQEARHLQDSLMDHLPNYFIFWKDLNGNYMGCNRAFAELAGQKDPKSLIGKSDYEYWSEEESNAYVTDDKLVMESGKPKLNIEESQTTPEGKRTTLSTSKVPLIDEAGKLYGLLGICSDITHQKDAEITLLEANKKLEHASKIKSEFIRNVSHDIRTPLSGILQSSRLMYEGKMSEEEMPEYAYHIWQATIRLMSLFNQVIEVTKAESYEFEDQVEKFNLHSLLTNLEKTYQIVAKHKGIELKLQCTEEVPKFLLGKHLRLHRILMNLLGNAFKFTETGSITLLVENAENTLHTADNQVVLRFTISDTGIGIPKDKYHIIFQPFERLQSTYQGQYPGSGLGLSLVKDYVSKMQGEVYVESEVGKGSKFTCILPFKRSILNDGKDIVDIEYGIEEALLNKAFINPKKPILNAKSSSQDKPYRILLVEDDNLAQKMGVKILEGLSYYQVDYASSGEKALEMIATLPYNLIYMDVGLPGIDGVETTRQIRANKQGINSKTYIIALTAHADEEVTQQCMDVGMQKVLQKPLTPEKAEQIHIGFIQSQQTSTKKSAPIDWNQWLERINGQEDLLNTTFHLLGQDLENNRAAIVESYSNGDLTKLKAIAHKLKGALGYCGLPRLENAIKSIEEAAKQNDIVEVNLFYPEVLEALTEVAETYKEWAVAHPRVD